MCGIAGIIYLNEIEPKNRVNSQKILELLQHRGPDNQTAKHFKHSSFFHSRLIIVDASQASNQPFTDASDHEAIVFNGEIFNYKILQRQFQNLHTTGDTEVLFRLAQGERKNCLNQLNGFFAFSYYNEKENYLLLARDRLGVKPLYYYADREKFAFASELKPLMELVGPQELNPNQLETYFRLNYCAGKESIFKNVFRLLPGQCIEIKDNTIYVDHWYVAPKTDLGSHLNKTDIVTLLDDAVQLRLQADVPVGTFLSGGLDSSIISALAKKHHPGLKTFSIGFENEHYFDETKYSELVAKHIHSDHYVFKLQEDDFLNNIGIFLGGIDEPFADSSAFNFYMLCKQTKQQVKVALSGDGADELFKGYHKHRALLLSENFYVKFFSRLSSWIPARKSSRHGSFQNKLRQVRKFNTLTNLQVSEKQKFLASISDHRQVKQLLKNQSSFVYFDSLFKSSDSYRNFNINDTFDLQTVLSDDMLVKVDRFSMQQGIEIRNPFLDYRIVEFALNLNTDQKINKSSQKIILKNHFRHLLPEEIFTRAKKGFELPLQKWLSGSLRSELENNWLNCDKIKSENILHSAQVESIKKELFSDSPGDSAARIWAIIIFESWLQNFKDYIRY